MLLGEYYTQQRKEEGRWYRLMCVWMREPPGIEEVFPDFATPGSSQEDEPDDLLTFQQVTASLIPNREN